MKVLTQRMLDQKMIGRAIIDRKRTINSSILTETRAIDREFKTNLSPSSLYNYYISICQNTTWDLMADDKVAKQLGYSARAVGNNRRKLVNGGWIKFSKYTHRGIEYGIWYIGKEVVKANLDANTTLAELNKLGLITDDELEAQEDWSNL